ncbi:MAG: paraquat-inducible protein A [Hyphomicrobiaceae bacterium]
MRLGGRRFLLSLAILAASVCLALGVTLPIIKLTKFVFWSTEHSLISTVQVLIRDGQTFLGVTVLVFSIVFPVLKLFYLLMVSTLPANEIRRMSRQLKALEWIGKWSMHDVLVLALTIFFIKSQGLFDAASLSGVYFFTAAVVLMILSYAWLRTTPREGATAEAPGSRLRLQPVDADPPTATAMPRLPLPEPARATPDATADLDPATRRTGALRNFALSFLIILATVFFALGVILPVIRFTTVYVWTREHSIATIIYALYRNQEFFLCGVLFAFSIFFPFLKLFYLLTLVTSPDLSPEFRKRSISTMEWLGRYSMTDVMVLALMIFYVNSSGYTEASVLPGAYFFAASVMMTMLAYGWAHTVPGRRRVPTLVAGSEAGARAA